MSHRALVAVRRDDGRYDVRVSRDAGADDSLDRLSSPGARADRDLLEAPLVARDCDLDDVVADHLDPVEHEALLAVGPEGEVVPHVVVPYVLATADGLVESSPRGAVLALVGDDGSRLRPPYVRGWVHGALEILGEAVDAGLLDDSAALRWLDDAVCRLAGDRHAMATVP